MNITTEFREGILFVRLKGSLNIDTVSILNGEQGEQGPQGEKGETGATGAQGPKGDSIESISIDNTNRKMTIVLTNGKEFIFDNIVGADGEDGITEIPGKLQA